MNQDEIRVLTAELLQRIYGSILDRGGRIDRLALEILGTDTHTGEPITVRINSETFDNWEVDGG